MSGSEALAIASLVVGIVSTVATSSSCVYFFSRNTKIDINTLKGTHKDLVQAINDLNIKNKEGAVVRGTIELSEFIKQTVDFHENLREFIVYIEERMDERCMMGVLRDLWAQNKARNSMEEKLSEVRSEITKAEKMLEKPVIGYKQSPEVSIVGWQRKRVSDDIWKTLHENIGTICIHGMVGVGKTAVAKYLHNQALTDRDEIFDFVIWVKVAYGAGIRKVQDSIAKSIGVELSGDSDTKERAEKLQISLLEKRKFLLVLDSMSRIMSLEQIGIPELGDGRKVIVTSRMSNICSKFKSSRKNFVIHPLTSLPDAYELFKMEMGSLFEKLETETITSVIAALRELDGLPLAVHMLVQLLRNIQEEDGTKLNLAWRKELDGSAKKMDTDLLDRLNASYMSLNETSRRCFMYMALFPKDHAIESKEVIEYWMWEGLLGKVETLMEGIERGTVILNELKNASLLQSEGINDGKVKMLNLIRFTVIETMANVFIRSGCGLTYLPLGHEWPSEVERASFMQNQLTDLDMKKNINYKRLATLFLQDNLLNMISDMNFFSNMNNLRVLDLSRTEISILPTSLSSLINLRALLLRSCPKLKFLPTLSKLKQLIVLDVSCTPLELCPEGINKMKKLRRLNLSQTKLKTFPANIISQLAELEELLMISDDNGAGYLWGSNEMGKQWTGACIEELFELERLVLLQLNRLNCNVLHKYSINIRVERNFHFCVGGFDSRSHIGEKSVTIIGDHCFTVPNTTLELRMMECSQRISVLELEILSLRNLKVFEMFNFSGLTYLFSVEIFESLDMLRELRVRKCHQMVEIVKPTEDGNPRRIPLRGLNKMVFFDLPKLKSVCSGTELNCPSLLSLEVWSCMNLKLPIILSGLWSRENLNLPVILPAKSEKIKIKGEVSWINSLKWDNCQNSDSQFQGHLNRYFEFEGLALPLESPPSTANARLHRQQSQEGSSSNSANVPQTHEPNAETLLGYRFIKAFFKWE